jgi:SAM-dependent methyltransferase
MSYDAHSIREMECVSIRRFVESCSEHFTGRVLDYGCGKRPYQDIIEAAGGSYFGHDDDTYAGALDFVRDQKAMGSVYYWTGTPFREAAEFDAILCTQVLQYVPDPRILLAAFRYGLKEGGFLAMTYPTSWEDFEEGDLWRFTKQGMTRLLVDAGFVIERHYSRSQVELDGFAFRLGYAVVASA